MSLQIAANVTLFFWSRSIILIKELCQIVRYFIYKKPCCNFGCAYVFLSDGSSSCVRLCDGCDDWSGVEYGKKVMRKIRRFRESYLSIIIWKWWKSSNTISNISFVSKKYLKTSSKKLHNILCKIFSHCISLIMLSSE